MILALFIYFKPRSRFAELGTFHYPRQPKILLPFLTFDFVNRCHAHRYFRGGSGKAESALARRRRQLPFHFYHKKLEI
jgi:hypothetical protein